MNVRQYLRRSIVGKYAFSHWHDIYSNNYDGGLIKKKKKKLIKNNYDGGVNIDDCVELIVL
jgi:hypothetical protein